MHPTVRHAAPQLLVSILALACLAWAACRTKPQPTPPPAELAVAEVADAPGPGIAAHPFARVTERTTVLLHEPETFRVARAFPTNDDTGYPAVGFELAAEEQNRFRRWTAERVGRGMAVLVDGDLMLVATLQSELPGSGYVAGGPRPFTQAEVERLIARLDPKTK